jgi:integrase
VSIRQRGPDAFQVRVSPFEAQTVPTRRAAERLELDLKLRRSLGDLYEEPASTLGDEIDGALARIRATRNPRRRTVEFYERSAKIWEPLRDMRIPQLRRAAVEDFITARAAEHSRSAKNELEFLKRVLREAKARGQRVDAALFDVAPIKHEPRRGRALTVSELYEFASWFPEYVSRLILIAGQVGARQNVWFNLTDDMLDLHRGTMTIPSGLAKNRKEHRIYLTRVEVSLLTEQLVARAAGASLVFPTATGQQWTANRFRERVWVAAVEAATLNDEEQDRNSPSVFEGFTFHLLRHTAGSLMALAGIDPAVAAERLGHTDGGALFLKRYRHLYEARSANKPTGWRRSYVQRWTRKGREAARLSRKGSTRLMVRMGGTGLEPVTPSLSSWCSPN